LQEDEDEGEGEEEEEEGELVSRLGSIQTRLTCAASWTSRLSCVCVDYEEERRSSFQQQQQQQQQPAAAATSSGGSQPLRTIRGLGYQVGRLAGLRACGLAGYLLYGIGSMNNVTGQA